MTTDDRDAIKTVLVLTTPVVAQASQTREVINQVRDMNNQVLSQDNPSRFRRDEEKPLTTSKGVFDDDVGTGVGETGTGASREARYAAECGFRFVTTRSAAFTDASSGNAFASSMP